MITYEELIEHYNVIRIGFAGMRLTRWQLTKLLAAQIWRELPEYMRLLISLSILLFPILLLSWALRPKSLRKLGIPLAAKSKWMSFDFAEVFQRSAEQYQDTPFLVNAFGSEYVVFPSSCFDEVKKLPATQASALAYFRDMFHQAWTSVGTQSHELLNTIAVDLTRAIPSLVQWRQQDCAAACGSAIGACPDWKPVNLYSTMQELVASTNASAFVGRDLGTNGKWIRLVEQLPMAVAIPSILVSYVPIPLRPLVKPIVFVPALWVRSGMKKLLTPIIETDMQEYESSKDKKALLGPREKGKVQLTGWLISRYRDPSKKTDVQTILNDYIATIFESTPSSAGALFFIMGELATDPKLAEMLRQELLDVAPDGRLPQTHLNELRKMDSVMRESTRMNPFSYLVLYRKLLTPTKLSVGPELPAGTTICVDAHHINTSPKLWEDPLSFDGLRHYKKRLRPSQENKFKFASLGSDAPGWGDGLQACPGRQFADNTLKICLAHLLLNYQFKLPEGKGKPKRGCMANGSMFPDMGAKILFRSRKAS